ncbi:unnamed protein product [Prorocentrum cordatum]|uniref:Uncharacterized protein n=1 Tax=Prorocentrum cordatum TaxID=2364126 RepID=A0ABN9Q0C1_9DINO|nr:unnamed protein product [Polarella glacialis]
MSRTSHHAMLDGALSKGWKSFWRQAMRSAERLPIRLAMRNMMRAVWVGLRYRLSPIAPAPTLWKRLDAAQRRMAGTLHGPARVPPGEQPSPAGAAAAHHKGVSKLISEHGGPGDSGGRPWRGHGAPTPKGTGTRMPPGRWQLQTIWLLDGSAPAQKISSRTRGLGASAKDG